MRIHISFFLMFAFFWSAKIILAMENESEKNYKNFVYEQKLLKENLENDPLLLNKKDNNGKTLLHYLAASGLTCGIETVRKLFDIILPLRPQFLPDKDGNTPLHIAADYSYAKTTVDYVLPQLLKYAIKVEFDIDVANEEGYTPLHFAAARTSAVLNLLEFDRRAIELFLNNPDIPDILEKIDVNKKTKTGLTPLHLAFFNNKARNIFSLIQFGADTNVVMNDAQLSEEHKAIFKEIIDKIKPKSLIDQINLALLQLMGAVTNIDYFFWEKNSSKTNNFARREKAKLTIR